MPVKFTQHAYRDMHEVYVTIEGADPIQRTPPASDRYLFRPEGAQVRYERGHGEGWRVSLVALSGELLTQAGERAAGTGMANVRYQDSRRDSWPLWLVMLVDGSMPDSTASVAGPPFVEVEGPE